MLRSFHYARPCRAEDPEARIRYSHRESARTRGDARVRRDSEGDAFRTVLEFYLIEKCIYEIAYEANNRPDWLDIPRGGLADLLA